MDLSGRVALVTGASRGIGREDALALARAGADVALADILLESDASPSATEAASPLAQIMKARGAVFAEATAAEIRGMGRRALAIKMDVTDRDAVRAGVERTARELGSLDILVNNAATLDHVARLEHQRDDLWERDLRVNLTGMFLCTRAAWPLMKARGFGRVITVSSVAGTLGGYGQASYATTKAGVLGFTRSMALEGARHGITVNAVVPGVIATEAFEMTDAGMRQRMIDRTAFRRAGAPADVANAVAFLCSDLASYLTGIALNVSGGIELFTF
ncbi:MAG: SDR family oxidoreductase [Planctomycetes bacterium]|nr:SDR family oxidoreductase [Planctomycetota bacterium]